MLMREAVDVVNTLSLTCAVHDDVTHDGIADECKFSGAGRRRKGDGWTIKVRSGEATSLALVAIVTSRTPAILNGEVGDAVRGLVDDDDGAVVVPIALAPELAKKAGEHVEWEEFSRLKLSEGGDLRKYYPLTDAARGEYEAWRRAQEK